MAKKPTKANDSPRIVNRRARHEYHVLEKLECGIMLGGSEVKSVREGRVSLAEGFAKLSPDGRELWLHNVDIGPYAQAGPAGHLPKAPRKLLAHKRQIEKLAVATQAKGSTLIPLAVYFVRGWAKLELGVCEGKRAYDKRRDIKERETKREMKRAMTRKRL